MQLRFYVRLAKKKSVGLLPIATFRDFLFPLVFFFASIGGPTGVSVSITFCHHAEEANSALFGMLVKQSGNVLQSFGRVTIQRSQVRSVQDSSLVHHFFSYLADFDVVMRKLISE
jgi:hypothetical protein